MEVPYEENEFGVKEEQEGGQWAWSPVDEGGVTGGHVHSMWNLQVKLKGLDFIFSESYLNNECHDLIYV